MSKYEIQRINYNNQCDSALALREALHEKVSNLGRPLRYCLQTFGCQQNENDSEKIRGILANFNFTEVSSYEEADLVFLNTCSIRENADTRLFGHLGKLKSLREKNKNLVVGVCGCLPTQEEQNTKIASSFNYVNMLFGPQDLHRLVEFLSEVYVNRKKVNCISKDNVVCEDIPMHRQRKFRALISIMFGCNNFCTYCVVPSTRERERSRLAEDILRECREVADTGIPEVMLLGQNVNAWGFDLSGGRKRELATLDYSLNDVNVLQNIYAGKYNIEDINTFPRLLVAISAIPGIKSVRYMSSHPRDFDGEMVVALSVANEIENHLHLPIQSGSNSVLRAMNRHHDRLHYLKIIEAVKKVRPNIALTTDIMVGFPTETEEDFSDTLSIIDELRFASTFSFIYSARPGTPAAEMTQISEDIKHERFDRMVKKLNYYSQLEHDKLLGTQRNVLLEGTSKGNQNKLTGRDSEFHLININVPSTTELAKEALLADGSLNSKYFEGRFMMVKITEAKTFSLEAESIE